VALNLRALPLHVPNVALQPRFVLPNLHLFDVEDSLGCLLILVV